MLTSDVARREKSEFLLLAPIFPFPFHSKYVIFSFCGDALLTLTEKNMEIAKFREILTERAVRMWPRDRDISIVPTGKQMETRYQWIQELFKNCAEQALYETRVFFLTLAYLDKILTMVLDKNCFPLLVNTVDGFSRESDESNILMTVLFKFANAVHSDEYVQLYSKKHWYSDDSTRGTYRKMESEVSNALQFNFDIPTACDFIEQCYLWDDENYVHHLWRTKSIELATRGLIGGFLYEMCYPNELASVSITLAYKIISKRDRRIRRTEGVNAVFPIIERIAKRQRFIEEDYVKTFFRKNSDLILRKIERLIKETESAGTEDEGTEHDAKRTKY